MNTLIQKASSFAVVGMAVLNMATGCTLPTPFNGLNSGTNYLLGVLKKDPTNSQIQKSGFVRANAVKAGDQVNASGLSTFNGLKMLEMSKDNLFLLTIEKGLFGSTDGGTIWERKYVFGIESTESDQTKKDQDITSKIARNDALVVKDFAVDPKNNDNIYLATKDKDTLGKIFQSSDKGKTFRLIYSEVNANVGVNLITLDPNNPLRIYAVLEGGALVRSLDGGNNWTKIYTFSELPIQLNFVPEFNNLFYALLPKKGMLTSSNDGANWEPVSIIKNNPSTSSINNDNQNQNSQFTSYTKIKPVIVANSNNTKPNWLLLADQGLYTSQEYNGIYNRIVLPIQNDSTQILDIAYDTKEGVNHLYASLRDKLLESRNSGQGWSWNVSDNIQLSDTIGNIGTILISKENPEVIYLVLNKPGLRR